MYTEIERQNILDKLLLIISSIHHVEGIILVGSGAIGFKDRFSDIDLVIVVSPDEFTPLTWDKINTEILQELNVCRYTLNKYGVNNFITVTLLKNFLEVDIGIISMDNLFAKTDKWKILFDKSGLVEEKMKRTWENRKRIDATQEVEESLNNSWYHIKNAVFALKRNKRFRVVKELEAIRDEIIRLKAIQENKISKHYRDVDEMEDWFVRKLESTFFESTEIENLTRAFIELFNLYFEIVKSMSSDFTEVSAHETQLRNLIYELDR